MLIVGLTGPSGAGKGVVCRIFERYGVPCIDTDAVYHNLLQPPSACLDELANRFGTSILNTDGTLDRKALSALVFVPENREKLKELNRITHRHILSDVRRQCDTLRQGGCPVVLVDAPQLYESEFDGECDCVIAVVAPHDVCVARIMARDGMTRERAEARLQAQNSIDYFRSHADVIIENHGHIEDMESDVLALLQKWGVRA